MRTARTTIGSKRRVGIVALGGVAVLALVGGSALSATAADATSTTTYSCRTTDGGTTLVDFAGGTGLVNLGSTSGLVGVATGSNGLQVGLLNCTLAVLVPSTTSTPTTVLIGTPTPPTVAPTVPAVPVVPSAKPTAPELAPSATSTTPVVTEPVAAAPTPAPTSSTTTTNPSGTAATKLAAVTVSRTSTTVYPAAAGYSRSKVVFSVKGLTAAKGAVRITGKAVLRKGTKVVKTWRISSSTAKLSWNGKVGKKVKAGVYVLTVTAKGADGVTKVTRSKVRVSAKHLVTRTATVESVENVSSTTATMPAKVVKAMKLGRVTVRVRTVATVTGSAKLVFSADGTKRSIPLLNGSHTSKAFVVPDGFESVTVAHRWKKGAATLTSFRAVFRYKILV